MPLWWVTVNAPGWLASSLTRLAESSAVPSYRGIRWFNDTVFEILECFNGHKTNYKAWVITTEECTIRDSVFRQEYTCSVRHIKKSCLVGSTSGTIWALNTKYWNVHTADGTFQVHKTIHDESEGSPEWTIEMMAEAPDADTLIRVLSKHISQ